MSISGYLSIYNDWDMLDDVLDSVVGVLDELVVVDGGYAWMADYLEQTGRDPERSNQAMHDVLARFDLPKKVLTGRWNDEVEKRRAGYEACSGDYVLRVDADEIVHFDYDAVLDFVRSDCAMAEFIAALCLSPNRVQSTRQGWLPQVGFLFDRARISALEHLRYLWLVLPEELQSLVSRYERQPMYPRAVAYGSHLSLLRSPDAALQRAEFYHLLHARSHGFPWLGGTAPDRIEDSGTLLNYVSAGAFRESLTWTDIYAGWARLDGTPVVSSPLTAEQEAPVQRHFDRFVASRIDDHRRFRREPRSFLNGHALLFEASAPESIVALSGGTDWMELRIVDGAIAAVNARAHAIVDEEPWERSIALPVTFRGDRLDVSLAPLDSLGPGILRRVIEIAVSADDHAPVHRLQLMGDTFDGDDGRQGSRC